MDNFTKLGLGTVQFGLSYGISNKNGQTPLVEVSKILKSAQEYGIETLDSASAYGNAEEVLGNFSLNKFKIVSKYLPISMGAGLKTQLNNTLNHLGIKCLYGYLSHRPLEILKSTKEWEELQFFKDSGRIKKIGFSLNEPSELDLLLDKDYIPDLVQVPYNYLDRRFEKTIAELKSLGCEIHTRSTFLQGLFFKEPQELGMYFEEVKPLLSSLQEDRKILPGQLLKFVLDQPFIDKVIIGVENNSQLIANLNSFKDVPSLRPLKIEISENILIPSRWPKN